MDVIFLQKTIIWKRLQFAHILSLIMHFHTGNVYCGTVPNFHASIFLTKKQIISIHKQHPQYGFTSITSLDFVLLMVEFHWKTKKCYMCKQESSSDNYTKIYTRKELVMMETTNSSFHTSFYIPSIQKLAFHLPHVRIFGINHCGAMWRTAFKRRELFQDVLCRRDYSERAVAIFSHQIQSEYYGGNRSVYLEGIVLEYFRAWPKSDINSTTPSRQRHSVFNSFLSDNSKQDAATTTAHIKRFISFLR